MEKIKNLLKNLFNKCFVSTKVCMLNGTGVIFIRKTINILYIYKVVYITTENSKGPVKYSRRHPILTEFYGNKKLTTELGDF